MLLDFFLYGLALVVALPLLVFSAECLAALAGPRKRRWSGPRPRIGVLVPAHNEEAGLARTIELARAQLTTEDRLLVVADNCDDGTAEVARGAGAEVLERSDALRRGKGYALAAGLERLMAADPPEVAIVLDADSRPGPGLFETIATAAAASGRPVQSRYLFEAPPAPSSRDRISALAVLFKNRIRLIGLGRLADASHVTGTGFAIPARLVDPVAFASGHITEDMELGLRFAQAGRAPLYLDHAEVFGVLPTSDRAATSQRTRWEHGHLSLLLRRGPRLLAGGLLALNRGAIALALDLLVPPMSLLFLVAATAVPGALMIAVLDSYRAPLTIVLGSTGLAFASFVLAWFRYGRATIGAGELARLPLYVLWKVPLYLRFLVRPEKKWVRTERDATSASRP